LLRYEPFISAAVASQPSSRRASLRIALSHSFIFAAIRHELRRASCTMQLRHAIDAIVAAAIRFFAIDSCRIDFILQPIAALAAFSRSFD